MTKLKLAEKIARARALAAKISSSANANEPPVKSGPGPLPTNSGLILYCVAVEECDSTPKEDKLVIFSIKAKAFTAHEFAYHRLVCGTVVFIRAE